MIGGIDKFTGLFARCPGYDPGLVADRSTLVLSSFGSIRWSEGYSFGYRVVNYKFVAERNGKARQKRSG
jgi:hypothetical protein